MNNAEARTKLLDMIYDGLLDKDDVILMCLKYMSNDDVADMMDYNELTERFQEGETS